jgi:plastocyanin
VNRFSGFHTVLETAKAIRWLRWHTNTPLKRRVNERRYHRNGKRGAIFGITCTPETLCYVPAVFPKHDIGNMKKSSALIMVSGLAAALQAAAAADITGTVTLKGTPPKEKDITPVMEDANCSKLHTTVPTTHFYVVGPKGELADVVVSLQGISGKSTGASAPPVLLDQKGCIYVPSIFAVQTGQKIIVRNSDPVLHNVHAVPAEGSGNPERNEAQLANGPDLTFSFPKPENFLKFTCDVHFKWMFAWVSIFDHPYFAVTGKDGTFKIANVPPGKYKIQAAHRKAGTVTQEIEVKEGEPAKADFTLEIK